MTKLLSIEWIKISRSRLTWITLALFILLQFVTFYFMGETGAGPVNSEGVQTLRLKNFGLYNWNNLWHNMGYVAGFFKFLPALLVLVWVTQEYQYKTVRQNLIDGLSREEWLASKLITVTLFSVFCVLAFVAFGLIAGFEYNSSAPEEGYFQNISYLFAYGLEMWFFLIFALFTGILFRKTGVAVILFMGYYLIGEPILSFAVPPEVEDYLPTQSPRNLIPNPLPRLMSVDKMLGTEQDLSVKLHMVLISLGWTLALLTGAYLLLKKRDQ